SEFDGDVAWIGNYASAGGTEVGNVFWNTGSITSNGDQGVIDTVVANFIAADLAGGQVTIEVTNPANIDDDTVGIRLTSPIEYAPDNDFNLLVAGDIQLSSSIQNAGFGNIIIGAGWDGFTDPYSLAFNSGSYGNNLAKVTVGGGDADGDVAVGTQYGTTSL